MRSLFLLPSVFGRSLIDTSRLLLLFGCDFAVSARRPDWIGAHYAGRSAMKAPFSDASGRVCVK